MSVLSWPQKIGSPSEISRFYHTRSKSVALRWLRISQSCEPTRYSSPAFALVFLCGRNTSGKVVVYAYHKSEFVTWQLQSSCKKFLDRLHEALVVIEFGLAKD